jgi:APA family basic amino acid/polyamine antiporter
VSAKLCFEIYRIFALMSNAPAQESLKREIGVRALSLAIVNITVGTGIFVLPALVAENLGSASILAYLVCGVLMFLIALCFAEVGSKVTTSGGTYAYIEKAFGPFAGFIANNIFWFGACVISDAAVANALADTLKYFLPVLSNAYIRALFFMILFGGFAILNIRSLKHGVRFIEIIAIVKLLPLILLVVVGSTYISAANFHWTSFPTMGNLGAASLLLFFAFMGLETPVTNSGEIKNPGRTVPLGIFFGISLVLILYISIQLVTQGVLGDTLLANKDSPLAAVAGIIFGPVGITLMIVATAICMLGGLGSEILSIPRVLYAGARSGIMPKMLGHVHPLFLTPHNAILVYAGLGFLMAVSGGFKQLAILSGASTLLIYFGVVLATVQLRRAKPDQAEKTFRAPGGIITPLLACGVILWLLTSLTLPQLISFAIFILALCLIYYIMTVMKKKPYLISDDR